MIIQPQLNRTLPAFGGVRYRLTHQCAHYRAQDTLADPVHVHDGYELYVNVTGNVSFLHQNKISAIVPFDVVLSRPGDLHHCIYHQDCTHEHYCLWFNDDEGGLLREFIEKHDLCGHIRLPKEHHALLQGLLQELQSADGERLLLAVKLPELLALLVKREVTEGEVASTGRITEILTYIDEHLAEIRCTAEIADAFFLSESSLNRLFRAHAKLSVHKTVEAKRLSRARELLQSGYSVTESCALTGFSDCSRFIARFKERFGMTPLKFQAAERAKRRN